MVRARLVMGAVPVLVRMRVWAAEAPSAMLPKLRLEGVVWRWDWMPVPVTGYSMGRVEAEERMESSPPMVAAVVGAKVTCSVQLVEAARVLPSVGQSPVAV
jgi:hypothetical protein